MKSFMKKILTKSKGEESIFRSYLEEKSFPMREFIEEMDVRELLFYVFLSSDKNSDRILEVIGEPHDIDYFYKSIQKSAGARFKKLEKEKLIEDAVKIIERNAPIKSVYSSIYDYNFQDDFKLINNQIHIIERLIMIQFSKKIKKIVDVEESSHITDIQQLESMYLYEHKPILNTLGLVMMISRVDSVKKDRPDYLDELRESLLMIFHKQFLNIEIEKRIKAEEILRKNEILIDRTLKETSKKEELFKKTKEKNNQLSKEIKTIEKNTKRKMDEIINRIEKEKEEKYEVEISRLKELVDSMRIEAGKQLKINEKHMESDTLKLKTEVQELTQKIKEYQTEIVQYQRKIRVFESKTLATTIKEYVKDNELPEEIRELLHEQLKIQDNLIRKREVKVEIEKKENKEQKIGYCHIEDGKHHVVFPSGEMVEIKELPDNMYIAENQFVKIDSNGTFKYLFNYRYTPNDRDYQIAEFGSVIHKGSEPVMIKAMWDERKIENIPSHVHLRDNQVISVNGRGELMRFYVAVPNNADNYMKSIQSKGHEAYYVMKLFPNGTMLRSVLTGEESFQNIDFNGFDVKEEQILCVKEQQVIYIYYFPRFYTQSSYYKKSVTGVAEIQDDVVFVRKLSGEIMIVKDIPPKLNILDGETIIIDENANFINLKKEEKFDATIERKRLSMTKPVIKRKSERISIERDILIVGKITYENSYKMAFFKNGYRAQVIDGYEPWTRIRSALKDKDAVVVVSDFISHGNMYKLKDEVLNIPLLFPEHNGANRILEEIDAVFEVDAK